jgi:charged multivesicular body protein 7
MQSRKPIGVLWLSLGRFRGWTSRCSVSKPKPLSELLYPLCLPRRFRKAVPKDTALRVRSSPPWCAECFRCQAKAKAHLSNGQKALAMTYLRSKKQLEDVLLKRVGAAEQLRGVIRSIDQAKGDVEVSIHDPPTTTTQADTTSQILSAYSSATSTLSTILANPLLSPDHIASTTDALADVLADQHEIDEAVRLGGEVAVRAGGVEVDLDDEALAAELEGLVEEEKRGQRDKEERERVDAKEREGRGKVVQPETKVPDVVQAVQPDSVRPEVTRQQVQVQPRHEQSWEEVHEDAQAREREERERAEIERMKRDERRQVAE